MTLFEQIQDERQKMEVVIREAVIAAISNFQAATGATPEHIGIELLSFWPIGAPAECKVGEVKATVRL